jgi:hypothetical protein
LILGCEVLYLWWVVGKLINNLYSYRILKF